MSRVLQRLRKTLGEGPEHWRIEHAASKEVAGEVGGDVSFACLIAREEADPGVCVLFISRAMAEQLAEGIQFSSLVVLREA